MANSIYALVQRYNGSLSGQERLDDDNRRLRTEVGAIEKSNSRLQNTAAQKEQEVGTLTVKVCAFGIHPCAVATSPGRALRMCCPW